MTHITQELKRFEEELRSVYFGKDSDNIPNYLPENAVEYILGKISASHTSYLKKQIEWLRGKEKPFKEDFKCSGCGTCEACLLQNDDEVRGYNSALTSVIAHLEEELKEINKLTDNK